MPGQVHWEELRRTRGIPPGITSHIVFQMDEKFEVDGVCVHKIYTLELSSRTYKITHLVFTSRSWSTDLHSDRTVAALLRHLRAERLRVLLAGDAKGNLQFNHEQLAHPQG